MKFPWQHEPTPEEVKRGADLEAMTKTLERDVAAATERAQDEALGDELDLLYEQIVGKRAGPRGSDAARRPASRG